MGDIIRLTGLQYIRQSIKSNVMEKSSKLEKTPLGCFLLIMSEQEPSAASIDLLIISELISVVALAFTIGTGDLAGGGGAASQPVKVAPAVLS